MTMLSDPPAEQAVSFFAHKRIILTGGGGSVGTALLNELLSLPVDLVRIVDNNEEAVFQLTERFSSDPRFEAFCCDVRDESELNRTFSGADVCFHAAALKHVPSCELSPFSAVQTNVIGSQQVIRAALRNGLSRVLFTSSDKAVNPTNVMGTSKLMGERLFTAANSLSEGGHRCLFGATRFGNVAGSRGSVIPLFCDQISKAQTVKITDVKMTRFIMTLEDSARLVIKAMPLLRGGEIFITKMPVLSILALARVLFKLVAPIYGRDPEDFEYIEIGPRPGEKIWEELNTDEEVRRTYDLGEYLVVLPALRNFYQETTYAYQDLHLSPADRIYHSANEVQMSDVEIEQLLRKPGVLPAEVCERLV